MFTDANKLPPAHLFPAHRADRFQTDSVALSTLPLVFAAIRAALASFPECEAGAVLFCMRIDLRAVALHSFDPDKPLDALGDAC